MFSAQASQVSSNNTLYVEDVFSAFTRTGTGAAATVTTGVDLSTKGGLLISKARGSAIGWSWQDTMRGAGNYLASESTGSNSSSPTSVTGFTSSGYTLGADGSTRVNQNGTTYIDWTFRKAPKFFDVVTWTGDGVSTLGGRSIPHNLGVPPGMLVVKAVSGADSWYVYHASLGGTNYLTLQTTSASSSFGADYWGVTSTAFNVSGIGNTAGVTYVAYLFAHDPSATGIIQCGSFTTDGSGNGSVNHGKTQGIQFAMLKCSSTTGDWETFDTARTSGFTGNDARLRPNLANAEDSVARVSSSGTTLSFSGLSASQTYIYVFITARIV